MPRSETLDYLLSYLHKNDIETDLLVNKSSIFSAYAEQFELDKDNLDDEDIIILCHDDIEILTDSSIFKEYLIGNLHPKKIAFVGVAGTTRLEKNAIWWNHDNWRKGLHRGLVFHGKSLSTMDPSWYGKPGKVVVLDGLFLAAKVRTLKEIGLEKPDIFTGEWDFYDIWYTLTAYEKGYENKVIPVHVRHQSTGELVGRDSWHDNRTAFIKKFTLPIQCQPPK
jgi:hypothetical protein